MVARESLGLWIVSRMLNSHDSHRCAKQMGFLCFLNLMWSSLPDHTQLGGGRKWEVWKLTLSVYAIPVVQSLSCIQLFATLWTVACQVSLFFTISQSLLKLMSIESVMPSNHLFLCWPLLLPSSIFPSIRVFSNESVLHIRWPKYWSFSFRISPSKEYSGWFPLGLTALISLLPKGLLRIFSNTTILKHQFFGAQPSLWYSYNHIRLLEKP